MTNAPIISFYASDDSTQYNSTNPVDHGAVVAGNTGNEIEIHIWNNKGGASAVANMTNITLGILTANGLITGDTNVNGQDIVTEKWMNIICPDKSGDNYETIGGATVKSLPDISGAISGAKDTIKIKAVVPSNAEPVTDGGGNVIDRSYIHRVYYSYS